MTDLQIEQTRTALARLRETRGAPPERTSLDDLVDQEIFGILPPAELATLVRERQRQRLPPCPLRIRDPERYRQRVAPEAAP